MRALFLLSLLCLAACTPYPSKFDGKARAYLEAAARNQPNVEFLHSITELPASIRDSLAAGDAIADAGEPFSCCDGGQYPFRRFLAATKAGDTYTVAIEYGGYSYSWFVQQFVVDKTGKVTRKEIQPAPAVPRS